MRSGQAHLFQLPLLLICLLPAAGAYAQEREEPGKPIGKVSIVGNLILMELDEDVLGRERLFDLDRHTLRFTPAHEGYRVENLPFEWDADLGRKITEPRVALHNRCRGRRRHRDRREPARPRAEGIRKQWIDYFSITTGHRASMTASPSEPRRMARRDR